MKTGRLSKDEQRIIARLAPSATPEDIAKELDRSVESVENYMKKELKVGLSAVETAAYELEDRPYWIELEGQFTPHELELFKYHWAKIISQFKDDVFPTEEIQVVDVIKLELLMNRCLKTSKDNMLLLNETEQDLARERELEPELRDIDAMQGYQRTIASLRAAQESLNKDYRELQTKKATMLREIKGTREQRIKRLEDSKQSFTAWVASLMQDSDLLKSYGIEMEKMRLAMEKEKERLSDFHKFEDGDVDQPFLNSETVKDDNK